jgi:hypothetical protein
MAGSPRLAANDLSPAADLRADALQAARSAGR